MEIIRGKNGGFCFGVKRAIDTAKNLVGTNNYILGEIIHNDKVNNDIKKSGIKTITSLSDIETPETASVLIRTHGEPKSTFDNAEKLKIKVIDCTCPFVKDIQNIVEKHHKDGYKIVIIGGKGHPEVEGINGWCDKKALITESAEEISKLSADKICIVVQTTYSEKKFDDIIKKIVFDGSKTVDIFKTICYTTTKRQREAEILSAKCESMLVIGGANSNNTKKLFDICSENCKNSFLITDPADFDYQKLKKFKKVGAVLGASTPIEQFQEVLSNMEKVTSEEIVETVAEETTPVENVKEEVAPVTETVAEEVKEEKPVKTEMEAAFDKIGKNKDFKINQIVHAKISSVSDNAITLSIKDSKKDDFEISKEELINEYSKEDVGKDIRVMVVGKNPVKFSEKAMERVLKEEAEVEEIKNGKLFDVVIDATNKGGLIGKFGSYEVFVPASQIKLGFVKDMEKYVGKSMTLKAEKVESKGRRRQIVGSRKVILEAEKAERDAIKAEREKEFFDNVQVGDVILGTPVRFTSFGAFVDVNGFDCLAHISDLSWTGCKDCAEVLTIGKQTEFKVLKIDPETKRVSVGYKQLQPKPWDTVTERYNVGDVIHGKVVRIVNFGAFVEVEKGIDGLVHVSQISNKWLENPVTALTVGQEIDAKILDINPEKEKMNLSIKALLPEEEVIEKPETEIKGKKRTSKKAEENPDAELHEWKDETSSGISIAEILNSDNK